MGSIFWPRTCSPLFCSNPLCGSHKYAGLFQRGWSLTNRWVGHFQVENICNWSGTSTAKGTVQNNIIFQIIWITWLAKHFVRRTPDPKICLQKIWTTLNFAKRAVLYDNCMQLIQIIAMAWHYVKRTLWWVNVVCNLSTSSRCAGHFCFKKSI